MKLYGCILYVAVAAVAAATGRETEVRRCEKDDVHVCAEGCIEYKVCFMQTGDDIFLFILCCIYMDGCCTYTTR